MKTRRSSALIISLILLLVYVLCIGASAEERYKISYDKGLHNSYQGTEPDNFIKGNPPESFHVDAGGSFTVAQNTFTFRDYYFAGWSCTYTDASGSSTTKLFQPGDTVSNVRSDMTLKAVWAQSAKPLTIGGLIYYCETDAQTVTSYDNTHFIGETIKLRSPENNPGNDFTFAGWINSETGNIYKAGELFSIGLISNTFTAVWEKDGEPVNFCTVNVFCSSGGSASFEAKTVISGSEVTIELYPDTGFKVAGVTRNGADYGKSDKVSFTASETEEKINVVFEKINKETDPSPTEPLTPTTKSSTTGKTHTLTINKETFGGDGKIYINGVLFSSFGMPFDYDDGEILNISYEEDEGSELSLLQSKSKDVVGIVNYLGKGNPFQLTMNDSKTLTFKFKRETEKEKPLSGTPLLVLIFFIVALSICVSALYIMIFNKKAKKKKKKKRTSANTNARRR